MTVSLRALEDSDIGSVVEFSVRAWEPVFESMCRVMGPEIFGRVYPDWSAGQAQAVDSVCRAEGNRVWVAVEDGRPVGFVAVVLHDQDGLRSGEIEMVAVDPGCQGRGTGLALVSLAVEEIGKLGIPLVEIGTGGDPGHAAARRVYEKAGFTALPLVRYYKALPGSSPVDIPRPFAPLSTKYAPGLSSASSSSMLPASSRVLSSEHEYRGSMTDSHLLAGYLEAIGMGGADNRSEARLARGQFHDVVLFGEAAYRFPRDAASRRLLPSRVELLSKLGDRQLSFAIARVLSTAALSWPLGQCHVALRRLAGRPIEQISGPRAEDAVISCVAQTLDWLNELGTDQAIRKVVPHADPRRWERFADDVSTVLFPFMSDDGRARADAELNQVLVLDLAGDTLVHGDLGGANLLWASEESGPQLTGILDWDEAHIGNQADDLASLAVTIGWPLALRLDAQRHDGDTPTITAAKAIAATFALQQALPAALSGDAPSLADGLSNYQDPHSYPQNDVTTK